jgi:hypothetical protein
MRIGLKMMKMKIKRMSHLKRRTLIEGEMKIIVTPGFRRQTECEPCTCQDQLFTYTAVT